jgi:DNA-binding response OmpR family regulator
LLADDDEAISSMMKQILMHSGYSVHLAINGEEALKMIYEIKPDLILLDINMPKMTGYQVCQKIRADPQLKHVPVLMLTVLDRKEELIKSLDAGADDFINKPFNPEELMARVRAFLRTKQLHD